MDGIRGELRIVVEVYEVVAEAGVGDGQDLLSRRGAADARALVEPFSRVTSVDRRVRRRGRGLDAAEPEADAESRGGESEADTTSEGAVGDGLLPPGLLRHLCKSNFS